MHMSLYAGIHLCPFACFLAYLMKQGAILLLPLREAHMAKNWQSLLVDSHGVTEAFSPYSKMHQIMPTAT